MGSFVLEKKIYMSSLIPFTDHYKKQCKGQNFLMVHFPSFLGFNGTKCFPVSTEFLWGGSQRNKIHLITSFRQGISWPEVSKNV